MYIAIPPLHSQVVRSAQLSSYLSVVIVAASGLHVLRGDGGKMHEESTSISAQHAVTANAPPIICRTRIFTCRGGHACRRRSWVAVKGLIYPAVLAHKLVQVATDAVLGDYEGLVLLVERVVQVHDVLVAQEVGRLVVQRDLVARRSVEPIVKLDELLLAMDLRSSGS